MMKIEFRYAFIKELEVDRYPGYHKTSYEFFVGPDDGRDETIPCSLMTME